jgi:hypothetical protein
MYRILEGSEHGVVGIKVESPLSLEEYELLNSYLEQLMQEVGPMNFLCDMAGLEVVKSQNIWEEMTSHFRSLRNYQKIALVGDPRWPECASKIGDPSLKTQVKYFSPGEIDEAWSWVRKYLI